MSPTASTSPEPRARGRREGQPPPRTRPERRDGEPGQAGAPTPSNATERIQQAALVSIAIDGGVPDPSVPTNGDDPSGECEARAMSATNLRSDGRPLS
jgi:hypothetical protein